MEALRLGVHHFRATAITSFVEVDGTFYTVLGPHKQRNNGIGTLVISVKVQNEVPQQPGKVAAARCLISDVPSIAVRKALPM